MNWKPQQEQASLSQSAGSSWLPEGARNACFGEDGPNFPQDGQIEADKLAIPSRQSNISATGRREFENRLLTGRRL